MLYNLLMMLCVIISKKCLLGNIRVNETIYLNSARYVAYWIVQRLMKIANYFVLPEFKSTKVLVWYYRLLGATIHDDVVIDTLGISDPDTIVIHKGCVLSSGSMFLGSEVKDMTLTFDKIAIGRYSIIEARAVVHAGSIIDHYTTIPALSKVGRSEIPRPRVHRDSIDLLDASKSSNTGIHSISQQKKKEQVSSSTEYQNVATSDENGVELTTIHTDINIEVDDIKDVDGEEEDNDDEGDDAEEDDEENKSTNKKKTTKKKKNEQ